jgi:hypothetical protein
MLFFLLGRGGAALFETLEKCWLVAVVGGGGEGGGVDH